VATGQATALLMKKQDGSPETYLAPDTPPVASGLSMLAGMSLDATR
jgi:hypothetical protein